MKIPKIALTTLPNNPTDEIVLLPAASPIVGDEVPDPVLVLAASLAGTTMVLTMVDSGINEVTDPEVKVEKLVEVVMILLDPVGTETDELTVAPVGMLVTEVVDLNLVSIPFSMAFYIEKKGRTNPVDLGVGVEGAIIGELLLETTPILLLVVVVLV